jgi:hypothetical protein
MRWLYLNEPYQMKTCIKNPLLVSMLAFEALLTLCMGLLPMAAQGATFQTRIYTNAVGTKLRYTLSIPVNYDGAQKYPVVLYFHAATTAPTDDLGQLVFLSAANQTKHPCFFVGPQNADSGSTSYFIGMVDNTVGILTQLESGFSIDPDRLYITGASLGGSLTWYFVAGYPSLFAAAVTVSGQGWDAPDAAYRFFGSFDGLRVPFWVFQAADDNNNLVSDSDNAVQSWRAIGGNPIYTRYRSGGHVPGAAYRTAGLVDWVMAQKRGVISTNAPILSITRPAQEVVYTTGASTLNLSGSAFGLGQDVTGVTWLNMANNRTNTAVGTNDWTALDMPLEPDKTNTIVVAAAAKNAVLNGGGTTTFSTTLRVVSSPIRVTLASPLGAVFLNWTGGAPPYRVQQTIDPVLGPWTDVRTGAIPQIWLPRLEKHQFYLIIGQ